MVSPEPVLTADVRRLVDAVAARYAGEAARTNAEADGKLLDAVATPDEPGRELAAEVGRWIYVGDSTNDQAMFGRFATRSCSARSSSCP